MSTSGLIKLTSDRNVEAIVKYNTKPIKTMGKWKNQDNVLHQSDLVSFCGDYQHRGLPLTEQGNIFIQQVNRNASLSNLHRKRKFSLGTWPRSVSLCRTVIQSFDYRANPNLTPVQVHHMGIQMMTGLQKYFNSQYNYKLNGGLVSTHIDDDHEQFVRGKIHHTHLHNHIVIPSYNSYGQSISNYLRKTNLYDFQHLNDEITTINNLHDYHFWKLEKQIVPNSSFTRDRATHHHSHLQTAIITFTKANNHAFDKYPNDFQKARQTRNHELTFKYQYHTRTKKDSKTGEPRQQFTMQQFLSPKTHQYTWYNLRNLRILVWKNKKQEECERFIKQLNFSKTRMTAVSYGEYKHTITAITKQLPPLETLTSDEARKNHQFTIDVPESQSNSNQNQSGTWQSYLRELQADKTWKQLPFHRDQDFRTDIIFKNLQHYNNYKNRDNDDGMHRYHAIDRLQHKATQQKQNGLNLN